MTKFFIYLVFITVLLVDFSPQVKSQTKTTNADTTTTSIDSGPRECGSNEHLGYICGCGERCHLPREPCPQYCLTTLTCVCNKGYGRNYKTHLCVLCTKLI